MVMNENDTGSGRFQKLHSIIGQQHWGDCIERYQFEADVSDKGITASNVDVTDSHIPGRFHGNC